LISETLSFTPQSVAEPVTDGLKDADRGHVSEELAHHVSGMRLGYYEYPIMSEHHASTRLSSSATDLSSSKPVSLLPSSSYTGLNEKEVVHSAVPLCSKPGLESGLPVVSDHAKIPADSEVGSHTARIREYQDELLQRQTDRQHALLEARRRLQMRAEQLLDSGMNLLSESPSNNHRPVSHGQSLLTVPSEKSHIYEVENYDVSRLSRNDVSHVESSDMLQTRVDVSKPYKPESYQPKSLSEVAEAFEYTAAAASIGDDMDDERQFVTPELKEDSRVRPCRVAVYSPSPSPHANDAAYNKSQQLSVSPAHSTIQNNKDDFNSLILQAQRDLEVRQRQMQEQLEAVENEEQRLVEQQLRISSQLGSFPSKIQTFTDTSVQVQQQTGVLDSYISSSSDLLALVADGVSPYISARNTPSVSHDSNSHQLSASKESLDMSGFNTGHTGRMAVDITTPYHPQSESHQIHLSRSAPLLQSRSIHVTSDQLPTSGHSPVSVIFVIV